jgi:glycosyltransferase involved in cell wall biosynthesis
MVGSGSMLADLEKRAAERGILDACIFQPATSRVVDWLRHIDVFVLPSLSEAFSNSLMEAMACGCCAIASSVGGNPELVEDGKRGLLFAPGDTAGLERALQEVILDANLRRRLADAGRDFVRANFSRETAARRMGEIYSALLKETISGNDS